MSTLQEQLDRLIQRKGEQDPLVQMLRNQIQAQKSGKTFQELYLPPSGASETALELFSAGAEAGFPMVSNDR